MGRPSECDGRSCGRSCDSRRPQRIDKKILWWYNNRIVGKDWTTLPTEEYNAII